MKIPNFQPPNEIDHPDLSKEAYSAMQVMSSQIEKLTTALQKNMSPEDNENSETRVLTLRHGIPADIRLQEIKGKPREVRILDHSLFEKADLAWEVKDQKKIRVSVTWSIDPGVPVSVTLLIRGGGDGN